MKIIVLIKQVPEMNRVKFDREKGVIDRKSAGVEINPFDLNALEAAVRIKEELGGEVITISMGPERAAEALRDSLARGADRGILLTDSKFAGADTISTSKTLSAAIRQVGDFELIIAGEMTVDGDTAQVGPQTAEFLNIPHVAYVTEVVEVKKKTLSVVSSIWDGEYLKQLEYPGLITVTKDLNTPRLPSFKDKMKARKAEIETWAFSKLCQDLEPDEVGLEGSPTWVDNIQIPDPIQRKGQVWRKHELPAALDKIQSVLEDRNVIRR